MTMLGWMGKVRILPQYGRPFYTIGTRLSMDFFFFVIFFLPRMHTALIYRLQQWRGSAQAFPFGEGGSPKG